MDDERVYEHLAGHWIMEIAEMLALNNAKCNEASKADIRVLEDEASSREYMRMLWAEAMTIYRSGDFRLRLPREMEANLVRYQAPFMQEDTWADLIKSFLEEYEGDAVCCQMLYREALDMYGMPNRMETTKIMEIMSGIAG